MKSSIKESLAAAAMVFCYASKILRLMPDSTGRTPTPSICSREAAVELGDSSKHLLQGSQISDSTILGSSIL
jgi:hypothetical protein